MVARLYGFVGADALWQLQLGTFLWVVEQCGFALGSSSLFHHRLSLAPIVGDAFEQFLWVLHHPVLVNPVNKISIRLKDNLQDMLAGNASLFLKLAGTLEPFLNVCSPAHAEMLQLLNRQLNYKMDSVEVLNTVKNIVFVVLVDQIDLAASVYLQEEERVDLAAQGISDDVEFAAVDNFVHPAALPRHHLGEQIPLLNESQNTMHNLDVLGLVGQLALYQIVHHLVLRIRHAQAYEVWWDLRNGVLLGLVHKFVDSIHLVLGPGHCHCLQVHFVKFVLAFHPHHLSYVGLQFPIPETVVPENVESIPKGVSLEHSILLNSLEPSQNAHRLISYYTFRLLLHILDEFCECFLHIVRTFLSCHYESIDGNAAVRVQPSNHTNHVLP